MKKHPLVKEILTDSENFWQALREHLLGYARSLIEEMIEAERDWFVEEMKDMKNGYRKRDLITNLGKIEGIRVGRTREKGFFPSFLKPYQRRVLEVDEFITALYSSGLSTRKIAKILERFYGYPTSQGLISTVTERVKEKMEAWKRRKLKENYLVLFIDAGFFNVRRDVVEKEAVYFVLGIDEDGYQEIIDYALMPTESKTGWEEVLEGLKARGVKSVEFIVADGLPGLSDAVKKVFPAAKFQLCWQHKIKNILQKVRIKDRDSVHLYLQMIYSSETKEKALRAFELFKKIWQRKYPEVIKSLEKDLPHLLTFFDAPAPARRSIYTTNILERAIKEFRRRIKIIDSLPSPDALLKLIFLRVMEFNSSAASRKARGFANWSLWLEMEDELKITQKTLKNAAIK